MFTVSVLAVGKLKESFYRDACAEYQKRLAAYCRLEVTELPECRLPERPSPAEIAAGTDAIKDIEAEDGSTVDVYTLDGVLLRAKADATKATEGLAKGVYIVGKKKVIVR